MNHFIIQFFLLILKQKMHFQLEKSWLLHPFISYFHLPAHYIATYWVPCLLPRMKGPLFYRNYRTQTTLGMPQPYFTVEMKENTDLNPGQVSTSSSSSRAPEPVVSVLCGNQSWSKEKNLDLLHGKAWPNDQEWSPEMCSPAPAFAGLESLLKAVLFAWKTAEFRRYFVHLKTHILKIQEIEQTNFQIKSFRVP